MELARSTSRGGFFVRSVLTFVFTVFLAAFLWLIFSTTQADAAAPAKWDGNAIVYEGNSYSEETATSSSKPPLPSGTKYYRHLERTTGGGKAYSISFAQGTKATSATSADYTVYDLDSSANYSAKPSASGTISILPQGVGSSSNSSTAVWENGNLIYKGNSFTGDNGSFRVSDGVNPPLAKGTKYYQFLEDGGKKAHLIYFAASTDPPKATTATYITYDITSNGNGSGVNWNNASQPATVTIDASTAGNTTAGTPGSASSDCAVEGIGWIICPVSNFLATGMDRIFDMLKGFLVVEPLSTQTDSPLFQAWNLVRSIANVAFVIVFLVIIYSQLTSLGISSYGIKKLLPRLIVAALLMNLSYIICATAVDISNIAGSGLQELLVHMRESLNGPNTNSIASWQSVTGFILADTAVTGAAAVTIGGIVISSGASLGAALILLVPMLLGLILAVLVALIVLAARQALIIILIILAPLAFVANLLPNTEKLFTRWREVFVTMLVFFPLFALIFGGSQLAAFLIIQSAHDINVILLAMFVQVAPLVLTPLLVRFSGGIIGRIAGFVNDPKKGLIDRTRNWAKGESEYLAARNMARRDPVRNHQVLRRFALGYDQQRRIREGRKTAYNAWSDARWNNSQDFSNIDQMTREASDLKTTGESASADRYNTWKSTTPAGRRVDSQLRMSQQLVENSSHTLEQQWERNHSAQVMRERVRADYLAKDISALKKEHEQDFAALETGHVSGRLTNVRGINNYSVLARDVLNRTNIANTQLSFAQSQQQVDFANLLKNNVDIARQAGGVADQGAKRAQANAEAVITRAKLETIKAIKDATSVRAGDVEGMAREIRSALDQNDVLSVRAYSDMLAESANPGITKLREVMLTVEARLRGDDLQEVKEHLNASATVNSAAEDIGTWSRETGGRTLRQVTRAIETYNEMTPVAFAGNKKSTQIEAFKIGAISPTMATDILNNPAARGNLKPSMVIALQNIAAGRQWHIGVDVDLDEDN